MNGGDDFQRQATVQGRSFEEAVATLLKVAGWEIIETHAVVKRCEIDIVAIDPHGARWWIECKGSWRGNTPGSKRGDTVKKAIATAWHLSRVPDAAPYMLVTNHLPSPGTLGALLLEEAIEDKLFAQINTLGFLSNLTDTEDDA